MITISFLGTKGSLLGFRVQGHALCGKSGTDIVCAAVSSAAYMAANTLTEILEIQAETEVKDGYMEVSIPKSDADKAKTVMSGLELHLSQLSGQYPKNIEIVYTEVTKC